MLASSFVVRMLRKRQQWRSSTQACSPEAIGLNPMRDQRLVDPVVIRSSASWSSFPSHSQRTSAQETTNAHKQKPTPVMTSHPRHRFPIVPYRPPAGGYVEATLHLTVAAFSVDCQSCCSTPILQSNTIGPRRSGASLSVPVAAFESPGGHPNTSEIASHCSID